MNDLKIQADLLGDMSRYENCRDLKSLFRQFHTDHDGRGPASDHRMGIDVHDAGAAFVVRVSIAGARKKTIDVEIEGCEIRLRVAADAVRPHSAAGKHPYSGAQYRRFMLGHPVEPADAVIQRHDDLLELTLPKKRVVSIVGIVP